MAQLTNLEQVQEDAKRITLKRIQEQAEAKAWQEAKVGTVTLDESVEAVQTAEAPVEAVKTVKSKKEK